VFLRASCAFLFLAFAVAMPWERPARAVTVDGRMDPGEWNNRRVIISDPDETAVTDNDYDIQRITLSDGNHQLYVGLNVYGDHPALAAPGSERPYLNFYFNLYGGGGVTHRFGLTYNDGYGLPQGNMHLIEYDDKRWYDVGTVQYAIDEAVEVAIPWTMLPEELIRGGPIAVQGLFFLYNVAPGDANGDGSVDVFDLAALASNYRKTTGVAWPDGDFNLDGAVNIFDLATLASHYRSFQAPEGAQYDLFDAYTTVDRNLPLTNHTPEPLTLLGVTAGLIGLGRYVRRRKRMGR